MRTVEFITALFCEVDEQLRTIPKHPEAHIWPSEVVTLGLLHALKGMGNRPFYRSLTRPGMSIAVITGNLAFSPFLDVPLTQVCGTPFHALWFAISKR